MNTETPSRDRATRIRGRRKLTGIVGGLAAVGLVATGCGVVDSGGGADGAIKLTLADFGNAKAAETQVLDAWQKEVTERTDGRVTFEAFHQESLCKAEEIITCVQDGRADLGFVVPSYTPEKFPLAELMHLPMESRNPDAVGRAYEQLSGEIPEIPAESESQDLKSIMYLPVVAGLVGAKKPLNDITDFRNLSIRAIGDGALQLAASMKAKPVAIPVTDLYEGMQRGVVDAWLNNLTGAADYNLYEVSDHLYDVGSGVYTSVGLWMSQNSWDELPEDVRKIIDETTNKFLAGPAYKAYAAAFEQKCDKVLKAGTVKEFGVWREQRTQQLRDALGERAVKQWAKRAKRGGVSNSMKIYDRYKEILRTQENNTSFKNPNKTCAERFNG